MSPPALPPLPSTDDRLVRLGTVVAALAKLNINISIEDLLKGIHEEDEASRAKYNVVRNPPPQPAEPADFLPVGKPVPNPARPRDPLREEYHRRLREYAEQEFPNGKVPDPLGTTGFGLFQGPPTDGPVSALGIPRSPPGPLPLPPGFGGPPPGLQPPPQ